MNPRVRPLTAGDAKAYQGLRLFALAESPAAFSASPEEEVDRSIEQVTSRIAPAGDGCDVTLGAFEDEVLRGFVAILRSRKAKLRHGVEFAGMYVAPTWRGRGLGRILLDMALAHVYSMPGVCQVKLSVNASNQPARVLYRSVGFVPYALEPRAMCIGGDMHALEHYLLLLDVGEQARRGNIS